MSIKAALYYVDLGKCYKFGVSSNPNRRYKDFYKDFNIPAKPIFELHFDNQEDAYKLEGKLKSSLKAYKFGENPKPFSLEYTTADQETVSTAILEINPNYEFIEPGNFQPNIRIKGNH